MHLFAKNLNLDINNMSKKYMLPVFLASAIVFSGGCRTYQKLELSHDIVLANVKMIYQKQNHTLNGIDNPKFAVFAQMMSDNNPELQILKAEYKGAEDRAAMSTPFPNPSLEIGQAKGYNLEDAVANKVQPFVGVGFTIPLGGRLGKEDDLHSALADLKRVNLISRHRSIYMKLRQHYLTFLLSKEELQVCDSIIVTSNELDQSTQNLSKMGTVGRLDVLDTHFDLKDIELKILEIKKQHIQQIREFAALVGTSTINAQRASGIMQKFKDITLMDDEKFFQLIGLNNAELVIRKAEFSVADAQLKHELSKQYPDISIGGNGEQEPGEDTKLLSLSIGFDLPIFDRNQQGISDAESKRSVISKQYQSDVQNTLTDLERLRNSFVNNRSQIKILNELVKISTERLETARQSLSAGSIGMTRYLDMHKEHDMLLLGQVEKKREFWQTVFELETNIGIPLIALPGESFNEDVFNYTHEELYQKHVEEKKFNQSNQENSDEK